MRTGQARKRDASETSIVAALRAAGAFVIRLSDAGAPDLLVLWRGVVTLLECKTGKGRSTRAQLSRSAQGWPVTIVRTPSDALTACGVTR